MGGANRDANVKMRKYCTCPLAGVAGISQGADPGFFVGFSSLFANQRIHKCSENYEGSPRSYGIRFSGFRKVLTCTSCTLRGWVSSHRAVGVSPVLTGLWIFKGNKCHSKCLTILFTWKSPWEGAPEDEADANFQNLFICSAPPHFLGTGGRPLIQ